MTSKNIATIILKKKSGFEIENITRTVELDYYNHNSFDDIIEDCLLKMQTNEDVVKLEISIKRKNDDK